MARHANAGVDVVVERDDVDRNPRPGAVSDARAQRSYIRKKFDLSQNPGRKPGILTSALANAHSERQMIFFFLLHFVATMIVWQHHMYFKFRQRAAVVPEGANLYWWKRLVPPVEFGTMHAMLLQLALIPMTMARHTIATLSATSLARFVPFQHTNAHSPRIRHGVVRVLEHRALLRVFRSRVRGPAKRQRAAREGQRVVLRLHEIGDHAHGLRPLRRVRNHGRDELLERQDEVRAVLRGARGDSTDRPSRLLPIRPRGERRSLRTFPVVALHPRLPIDNRPSTRATSRVFFSVTHARRIDSDSFRRRHANSVDRPDPTRPTRERARFVSRSFRARRGAAPTYPTRCAEHPERPPTSTSPAPLPRADSSRLPRVVRHRRRAHNRQHGAPRSGPVAKL
eukprot:29943-Pelagococcus_subviridis.AAC.1